MTEYTEMIERKRKQLQAEEWAKGVQHIHVHRLTSMWYETRPEDMKMGNVIDTTYNDGTIERKLQNGGIVFMTDEKLTGDALIDAWEKATHNLCVCGEQDCPEEYSHTTHGY